MQSGPGVIPGPDEQPQLGAHRWAVSPWIARKAWFTHTYFIDRLDGRSHLSDLQRRAWHRALSVGLPAATPTAATTTTTTTATAADEVSERDERANRIRQLRERA